MIRGSEKTELFCECDGCGTEEYAGTLDFHEFVAEIKAQGWKISKDEDQWLHFCPECQ